MTYHEGRRNVIILRGLRIESRATSRSSTGSVLEGLEPQNPVFKKMLFITIPGSFGSLLIALKDL